ncbi:MAG: uracil-DNA glycosylase family protein, partial [Sphingomonas sp.]
MGADQHIDWNAAAASALDWWQEAGVDTLVDEAPRDWLASVPSTGAGAAAATAAPAPAPEKPPATLAAFEAWRIGSAAPDAGWGRLIAAEGNAESGLMVLVDMPEREDAASGRLLTGEAGRLFDRMLAAIGRDRQSIYLASLAAARPIAGQIAAEDVAPLAALSRQH